MFDDGVIGIEFFLRALARKIIVNIWLQLTHNQLPACMYACIESTVAADWVSIHSNGYKKYRAPKNERSIENINGYRYL